MTTIEPAPTAPFLSNRVRAWLLVVLFAGLPFLLRVQLDDKNAERQAVLTLYRTWRFSEVLRNVEGGRSLNLVRIDEKSSAEELFSNQMQRDFRLSGQGALLTVRARFSTGAGRLRARIESDDGARTHVWEGDARLADNGFLLAPWAATLALALGRTPAVAATVGAVVALTWAADWSPLDVPMRSLEGVRQFADELHWRVRNQNWVASEMGRVPWLGLLVWLIGAGLALPRLIGRRPRAPSHWTFWVWGGLLLEPVGLWAGTRFGQWSGDAVWWKVWLGSYLYRFVTVAVLVAMEGRDGWRLVSRSSVQADTRFWLSATARSLLLLPIAFVLANAWDWLGAVMSVPPGDVLARARLFWVGALVGYFLAARTYGVWLLSLAFGVFLVPSAGHWNSAALFAALMDGAFVGWWLSPLKQTDAAMPQGVGAVLIAAAMAWMTGVVAASVGVPMGVCWVLLGGALWAYRHISLTREGTDSWA